MIGGQSSSYPASPPHNPPTPGLASQYVRYGREREEGWRKGRREESEECSSFHPLESRPAFSPHYSASSTKVSESRESGGKMQCEY
jgi:hypothetical protein